MSRLQQRPPAESAEQLMLAARRLFAERGVDGVNVREIAEAAGQRNHGAVNYHFGSKEGLVRALVVDGARAIDERRNAMLDALEADGGPRTIAEVVEALVRPSVGLAGDEPQDEDSYTRFIVMLAMTHKDVFMDALERRWNSGYQRCLAHLRRLMPEMPDAAKNERFVMLGAYLGSVLALREGALAERRKKRTFWQSEEALAHLSATIVALLGARLPRRR